MTCPRCALPDVDAASCPRCGVVFAKLATPRPLRPAPRVAGRERTESAGLPWGLIAGLVALLVAGFFGLRMLRPVRTPATIAATPTSEPTSGRDAAGAEAAHVPVVPVPTLNAEALQLPSGGGMARQDGETAAALARRVNARQPILAADVETAAQLFARHSEDASLKGLLEASVLSAAAQERDRSRLPQAAALLQRGITSLPGSLTIRALLLGIQLDLKDWSAAETTARAILALDPRHADALQGLGYALWRLDRNREATEALQAALELSGDPATQALLARVRKGVADESGMREQNLSHFHVRYDGEAHEDVGRGILRVLEQHYATLVRTLDHQPEAPIPVILFSSQAYFDAAGAPAWSGGAYDLLDGRIRIPIGGLGSALDAQIDDTLIHELTHAFVWDRSKGVAPREVHEGLAQYMEGKRTASMLGAAGLRALADGRIRGVTGYYVGALSFVEHLLAERGMGGMNELLAAMGATGNLDAACRQVHGQAFDALQQAWHQRLKQQYGS